MNSTLPGSLEIRSSVVTERVFTLVPEPSFNGGVDEGRDQAVVELRIVVEVSVSAKLLHWK